ncbi:hypothetical protein AJ80_07446 [Polytolypa hystricis UAMH7299]|uniref:DNA methylase n=1 Tax=Polytolypa hystricis (strain UAMH7299) TaxID=1447883 RepID=A0A2B7XP30_POLH7|nr:hypothetical protein AJ80_07446 [Polytolypa hystricis UAMH7299]
MPQKTKHPIYAADLAIDLSSGQESEYFKWFLACLLFGKPIQQDIAKSAYEALTHDGVTSPRSILDTGWDTLVEILDRAHYVRYDFSTATKLLDVSKKCVDEYGSFGRLLDEAGSVDGVVERLEEFSGVGPKTVEIFLRDMRGILQEKFHDEEEGKEEEEEEEMPSE